MLTNDKFDLFLQLWYLAFLINDVKKVKPAALHNVWCCPNDHESILATRVLAAKVLSRLEIGYQCISSRILNFSITHNPRECQLQQVFGVTNEGQLWMTWKYTHCIECLCQHHHLQINMALHKGEMNQDVFFLIASESKKKEEKAY